MFLVLALALMFNGATPENNYIWHKEIDVHSVRLTMVYTHEVGKECLNITGERHGACSYRVVDEGLSSCLVVVPYEASLSVIEHEKLHCAGYGHRNETLFGQELVLEKDIKWEVMQTFKK